jgi:hypothetical protein
MGIETIANVAFYMNCRSLSRLHEALITGSIDQGATSSQSVNFNVKVMKRRAWYVLAIVASSMTVPPYDS